VNVVLISDHETLGGAAQATSRLAEGLCREHRVTRLVRFPDGRPHPWRTIPLGGEEPAWRRQLLRLPRRLWPGSFPRPATPAAVVRSLSRTLAKLRPDVINLHNLHGAAPWGWGPEVVRATADIGPVVWTLHDMWSFTGRCAYAYGCDRFVTGCDNGCPTADEAPALPPSAIAPAWQQRQQLFASTPGLVAVTPSRWLAAEAQRGMWAGLRVEVIPYGLATDVYRPMDRAEARRRLGVDARGPVLLLSAHDLTERRKGAEIVPRLWRYVGPRPLTVLLMGHGSLTIPDPGITIHRLGWLGDDAARALAYSAADALLHPAPVDNFPNVILEALACGTPAVGLPIGGVPEMIRPGVTGWLTDHPTAPALGAALTSALADLAQGRDLRSSCRAVAEQEFPLALQAVRYARLFGQLRPR
jgi:glycosyltransferase involved in cell wall biosynthesis